LWLGASIAPLAAPIVYVFFNMAFVPDATPKHERTWEAALMVLTFVIVPASYLVSLVFGAPLIYFLKRAERLSFWWVSNLAAPMGAIALTCLLLVTTLFGATVLWERVGWGEVASFLGMGAALGVVTAVVFCVLAGITLNSSGRGNPCLEKHTTLH
jgi:hypothetical protein